MVDANQGWRMAGRPRAALGRRRPPRSARGRSSRSASTGSRSRCAPTTSRATRRCARLTSLRIAAGEMVRGAAEARDLLLRGGVDVIQPDVVLAGGIGGCRRLAGAGRPLRPRLLAAHLVERPRARSPTSTSRWRSPPAPTWRSRSTRRPGRRQRRDWLLPAPLEIAPDGTIAPPPGPGPRRRARPRRARGLAGGMRHADGVAARPRIMHPRRSARRSASRSRRRSTPPREGEVLVRVAAAGVCHSDAPAGRRPPRARTRSRSCRARGRGCRRGGRARASPASRRATGSRSASCRPAARAAPAAAGRFNLCETAAAHARGTARSSTARSRLALADGAAAAALQLRVAASRALRRRRRPRRCRSPPELPLWEAALLGCGVVTGVGAVRNAAGVAGGRERVRGRLRGNRAADRRRRAAGRAPGRSSRSTATRPSSSSRTRRGATHAVDAAGPTTRPPPCCAMPAAASTTPSRPSAPPRPSGWPGTCCGRARRPSSSASRPSGSRSRCPRIDLLSEKGLRGSYYGSANPAAELTSSPAWRPTAGSARRRRHRPDRPRRGEAARPAASGRGRAHGGRDRPGARRGPLRISRLTYPSPE